MACTYSLAQLLHESPMATGSLEGASCQGSRDCRDNVQIQAEGGSFTAAIEALPVELGVSCHVSVCRESWENPRSTQPGKNFNFGYLPHPGDTNTKWKQCLPPSPPTPTTLEQHEDTIHRAAKELARHHSMRPAPWSSGIVSTGWRGRCGVKEGGASAWTLRRADLHSVRCCSPYQLRVLSGIHY